MDLILTLLIFGVAFALIASFSIALIVFLGGIALGDRNYFDEEL